MNGRINISSIGLLLASCVLALPAVAGEFQWGEIEGSFNSQISVGASWRMSERDPLLVTPGNDSRPDPNGLFGVYGEASTGTADDGNANYDDGDMYSLILKGVHDLELRKGDFGVFVRGKYWYDQELAHSSVPHGNSSNFYASGQSLDDSQFDDFAKAKGIELLDAFIYGTFYLGENQAPLDLRIGRQVASWGESTFIQNGINSINPVDVSAFRRPGAEIKEGLLPVNMVTVSMGVTDALSFDAFYQLDWEKTVIDGCGTYFSTADVAATGCNVVTLTGLAPDAANMLGGLYITRLPDIEPDDGGQYGLSFRYFAEGLGGAEFGIYYMNYHSRIPYLGGYSSSNILVPQAVVEAAGLIKVLGYPLPPFIPRQPAEGVPVPPGIDLGAALGGGNPQYFAEFPEDIELFGVSFATNIAGFAVSGEVSHRPDFPVQINTTEILQGAVGLAPYSTVLPRVIEVGPGNPASGYDLLPVTQAQVTIIRFFDQVLGASRLSFAAEIGANWVDDLSSQTVVRPDGQTVQQRYGRSPTFGLGAFTPYSLEDLGIPPLLPALTGDLECDVPFIPPPDDQLPPPLQGQLPTIVPNTNTRNCTNDGYVTDSSWGYRIRAGLTYNDVFSGINLTPTLAWSHDVDGYSPNSNFTEGSTALSLGLTAEYLNRYTGSVSYTSFSGGDYSTVKDRDFLSLSFSVSF
jgi:hypothetical protein